MMFAEGDHHSFLREPHVKGVAEVLGATIDQVRGVLP
jgi:hypothetical protein